MRKLKDIIPCLIVAGCGMLGLCEIILTGTISGITIGPMLACLLWALIATGREPQKKPKRRKPCVVKPQPQMMIVCKGKGWEVR